MSSRRSRRLARLARGRSVRRRGKTEALRHKIRNMEGDERADLQAHLPPGYNFVQLANDPPADVMKRALETMGLPVFIRVGLASTPAGVDAVYVLQAAHQLYSSSYLGLARRFKRRPEVFAEFSAAWRLDASVDALKGILVQLWRDRP